MGIPGQSSDIWHTTGLPKDVISLIGVGAGGEPRDNGTALAEKLSAVFLSLWGVCLWCMVIGRWGVVQ